MIVQTICYRLVLSTNWLTFISDIARVIISKREGGINQTIKLWEYKSDVSVDSWNHYALLQAQIKNSSPHMYHHNFGFIKIKLTYFIFGVSGSGILHSVFGRHEPSTRPGQCLQRCLVVGTGNSHHKTKHKMRWWSKDEINWLLVWWVIRH